MPWSYLITRGDSDPQNFSQIRNSILRTISDAVESGISFVQIREKSLAANQLFELTAAVAEITSNSKTLLMVNGRPDIAAVAGADGVHLPESGLPIKVVKKAFPKLLIGASVHSVNGAVTAAESGADLAIFGNVFATPGKGTPSGVESLREVCVAVSPLPIIAVGGINVSEISEVLRAGAAGVAAIRMFNESAEMRAALSKINEFRA